MRRAESGRSSGGRGGPPWYQSREIVVEGSGGGAGRSSGSFGRRFRGEV